MSDESVGIMSVARSALKWSCNIFVRFAHHSSNPGSACSWRLRSYTFGEGYWESSVVLGNSLGGENASIGLGIFTEDPRPLLALRGSLLSCAADTVGERLVNG
jgi:hypothetical protein